MRFKAAGAATLVIGCLIGSCPGSASAATTWSGPIAANAGAFIAVSCPSSSSMTSCDAVTQTGNFVAISQNAAGAPVDVDPSTALTSIACPETTLCLAGDRDGRVFSIQGSSVTPTVLATGVAITAISCADSTLCAATDAGGAAFLFNGSSWSAPTQLTGAFSDLDGVSCTDYDDDCFAVDASGQTFALNSLTTWGAPQTITSTGGLTAISCASEIFCEAVGDAAGGNQAGAYPGHGSGKPQDFNPAVWRANTPNYVSSTNLDAVACTGSAFCDLAGPGGIETSSSASTVQNTPTWTQTSTDQNVTGVSCANPTYCVAVDAAGNYLVAATAPQFIDPPYFTGQLEVGQQEFAAPDGHYGSDGTYTYQWYRCSSSTVSSCSAIPGATADTVYVPNAVGEGLMVALTASDFVGASTEDSAIRGPITRTPTNTAIPTNITVPQISGTATVGRKLTSTAGTWTEYPDGGSYQWYLCAKTCAAVLRATGPTFSVLTADIGKTVAVMAKARNSAGTSKSVVSKETAVVPAPAATLKSWLSPLLHLSGNAGRLTAIKRAKEYRMAFKAAVDGTVKVTWTITDKIAHITPSRTITLASASAKTVAPSTLIKVKLTPTGVALLKEVKTERVTATATFTYTSGTLTKSDTATRALTLTH